MKSIVEAIIVRTEPTTENFRGFPQDNQSPVEVVQYFQPFVCDDVNVAQKRLLYEYAQAHKLTPEEFTHHSVILRRWMENQG